MAKDQKRRPHPLGLEGRQEESDQGDATIGADPRVSIILAEYFAEAVRTGVEGEGVDLWPEARRGGSFP
jgi:hypothetical protein